jgi:salicylate hydroxylase
MDKAVELLGDDVARNSQMYLGYHGHLLTFPIEHGKTMNGKVSHRLERTFANCCSGRI